MTIRQMLSVVSPSQRHKIKAWAIDEARLLDHLPDEPGAVHVDWDGKRQVVSDCDVVWWSLARRQVQEVLDILNEPPLPEAA